MSSKSSKYELQSPNWLNEKFFEKILRDYLNDDKIKVVKLTVAPATVTNDHYGSVMFRTTLDYIDSKENNMSIPYIVKMSPEMESVKKDILGSDSFIFKTEIRMYSETIPKIEEILRKYGDDTILGPKLVYAAMEPHQIIVLEDLTKQGFTTLGGKTPNEEQIKRAMLKIAKWHAVSYKLANEEPELITTYNDGNFNLEMEKIEFFASGIKSFIKNVLSVDDELKKYIPYFEKIDKTFIDSCSKMGNAYKLGDKALFVLNHGDFHYKNMMFRHKDSGKLDDLILIDFQMCYYGPAAMDLTYALYMLLDGDTRWNRREEIIYEYFVNFQETLKKIEFKGEIPKMIDLQIDLIKYQKLETVLLAIFLPVILAFNDEDLELDQVMESAECRTKLYQHPRVMQEVKRTLPKLLYKGALE
ncbi:uncharacterized protein LOC129919399 [Episyrphus balteatus]|uniref:uncharacterized protein LOC129919399 n=1 Tax=Episyrphus balteatus TaxID=286459 RepID=UPI0024851B83|nr:uncharacterized protein LOC129919399 [Episyrphus balteatus]